MQVGYRRTLRGRRHCRARSILANAVGAEVLYEGGRGAGSDCRQGIGAGRRRNSAEAVGAYGVESKSQCEQFLCEGRESVGPDMGDLNERKGG